MQCAYTFIGINFCICDEKFDGIIGSLLGRTLVFDNLDNANIMSRKLQRRVKVVTLDGQVINAGGTFTGGSVKQGGGMLSRADEIKRLISEADELKVKVSKLSGETSKLKEKISDLTSDRTDLSDRKDLLVVLKNTELQALEKISGQFESNKALLDKLKEDYRQMLEAADRYDDDIAELRREEEAQNKKIAEYTAAREARHSQKVECEDRLKEFEDEKTAAVIRSSEIQKDIENARALLEVSLERIWRG